MASYGPPPRGHPGIERTPGAGPADPQPGPLAALDDIAEAPSSSSEERAWETWSSNRVIGSYLRMSRLTPPRAAKSSGRGPEGWTATTPRGSEVDRRPPLRPAAHRAWPCRA